MSPSTPLAYFITFTCYGSWLHGDERGSVDRDDNVPGTPVLLPDPVLQAYEVDLLREPPYLLDPARRQVTLRDPRNIPSQELVPTRRPCALQSRPHHCDGYRNA